MSTVKHDYLLGGRIVTADCFKSAYFDQLTPAEAGRCMNHMIYKTLCACSEYGSRIHNDPEICQIILDPTWEAELMRFHYTGAYFFEIDDEYDETHDVYRYHIFFILISSSADHRCVFFDARCA